jgi:long-chain fatty acid transport protein
LLEVIGGFGGEGGLQGRAYPGGASAAYFNPALLTESPAGLSVGFYTLSQQIGVSLDRRPDPSFDVPEGIQRAHHADGSALSTLPLPTIVLQNGRPANDAGVEALPARPRQGAGTGQEVFTYEMIGLNAKFFRKRLSFGFYALIPNGNFTVLRAPYVDEREQYFSNSLHPELYSERLTAISLAAGIGIALSDEVSIGALATIGLKAGVGAPVYVANAGKLNELLLTLDSNVNVSVSPHFGLSYKPTDRLRLTGTVHTPQKVELEASYTFLLATGVSQTSGISFVLDYMPWQFGAGAAYDVLKSEKETITIVGSGLLGLWSNYINRHGESPHPAYPWADTLTGTAGVRYDRDPVGIHFDMQYKPSPVPPQTGRTSYVDNDTLAFQVGSAYRFTALDTGMRIGAQFQTSYLIPRHQWKLMPPNAPDGRAHTPALVQDEVPDDAMVVQDGEDIAFAGREGLQTNSPGFPGYGSSGWIVGGGIYFTVEM